jgi:hypothetical protein
MLLLVCNILADDAVGGGGGNSIFGCGSRLKRDPVSFGTSKMVLVVLEIDELVTNGRCSVFAKVVAIVLIERVIGSRIASVTFTFDGGNNGSIGIFMSCGSAFVVLGILVSLARLFILISLIIGNFTSSLPASLSLLSDELLSDELEDEESLELLDDDCRL